MIRVIVVDDHTIVREGVRRVLELHSDLRLVGEAADGASALACAASTPADVITVDLSLPDMGGAELVRRLRDEYPLLAVIVLTMYPEDQLASHLFELGVMAFLSKGRSSDELIAAIRTVHSGERIYPPSVDPRRPRAQADGQNAPHHRLSAREMQVFLGLIEGRTPSELAYELELSPSTISNHIASVRAKLGATSKGDILRYASRVGLLD